MKMKPAALACLALLLGGLAALPAMGQDPGTIDELKAQLQKATDTLKQQQAAIEAMQKKIAELEGKAQAAAPRTAPEAAKAEAAAPKDSGVSVAWKDHRTTFTLPNFEMKFYSMLQPRYSYVRNDDPDGQNVGSFRMRRARMYIEGWAGSKDLTYFFQADWLAANPLLDGYINYDFTGGKKWFMVRAGQFKVPFGRQMLTGDSNLQFTDRSLATNYFCHDRDLGVMIHGQFGTSKVKDMFLWSAGVYNGNGINQKVNDNAKYQTDYRLVFSPWGSTGYSESNLENFQTPRLSIGANYENNDQRYEKNGKLTGTGYHMMGYDLSFKWQRLSAYYEYYDRRNRDAIEQEYTSNGYTAQLGVFAIPMKLEFALKTSRVDPDTHKTMNVQKEDGAVMTWYLDKHYHKLAFEYLRERNAALKFPNSYELRVQWQLVF